MPIPCDAASRLGGFFDLAVWDGNVGCLDPHAEVGQWQNLGAHVTDDAAVRGWLGRAAASFARQRGLTVERVDVRALGAVLHLGWCSRLVSPWVARAVLCGDAYVPAIDELWWKDDGTTTFALAVAAGVSSSQSRSTTAHADFASDLVERILAPLAECGLTSSTSIAWGNAASAINGAVTMIARAHPEHRATARQLGQAHVRALPAASPSVGAIAEASFRRRSCCQLYRLPGVGRGGVCGDCVLRERNSPSLG